MMSRNPDRISTELDVVHAERYRIVIPGEWSLSDGCRHMININVRIMNWLMRHSESQFPGSCYL
jgi:hypothetical protein